MTSKAFNWGGDTYVDIDFILDDDIRYHLHREIAKVSLGEILIEDPIKRLELIEALRASGYAVEPS